MRGLGAGPATLTPLRGSRTAAMRSTVSVRTGYGVAKLNRNPQVEAIVDVADDLVLPHPGGRYGRRVRPRPPPRLLCVPWRQRLGAGGGEILGRDVVESIEAACSSSRADNLVMLWSTHGSVPSCAAFHHRPPWDSRSRGGDTVRPQNPTTLTRPGRPAQRGGVVRARLAIGPRNVRVRRLPGGWPGIDGN